MRKSGEMDFRFRLKLNLTFVESTYPSKRPQCSSLSPYFLLIKGNKNGYFLPKDLQFCLLFAEIASKRLTVGDANKPKCNRVGLGMGVALTLALRSRALAEKLKETELLLRSIIV